MSFMPYHCLHELHAVPLLVFSRDTIFAVAQFLGLSFSRWSLPGMSI